VNKALGKPERDQESRAGAATGAGESSGNRTPVRPGGEGPDVHLNVPQLKVDEISLDVENPEAHVSLSAGVLDLMRLNVGADAYLGKVNLEIKGVEAQALLQVRLDHVAAIIDRVLTTLDRNPELLQHIGRGVESAARGLGSGTGEALGEVGTGTKGAVAEVGRGAGDAVADVGEGTGRAAQDVGEAAEGAGQAVGGVVAGMEHRDDRGTDHGRAAAAPEPAAPEPAEPEPAEPEPAEPAEPAAAGNGDQEDVPTLQNALHETQASVRDFGRAVARMAASQVRSSR
jgi:hypothetical protein